MKRPIKIANRIRPFSHTPGTSVLIPQTRLIAKVFPARLEMPQAALDFKMQGPVRDFTVMQDLEKWMLRVFGKSDRGYFRYVLFRRGNAVILKNEKMDLYHAHGILKRGEEMTFPYDEKLQNFPVERLCLGCHKAQDIDLMRRRLDLKEILPIWFRLGQNISSREGEFFLLNACENTLNQPHLLPDKLIDLFSAHFKGIFAPTLEDTDHLGLTANHIENADPFSLLKKSSIFIRKLFYRSHENVIEILPSLPRVFHAGRFISIQEKDAFTLDMHWSKGLIKRMVIHTKKGGAFSFCFQKDIKTYRLIDTQVSLRKNRECITLESNRTYFFDRFQR